MARYILKTQQKKVALSGGATYDNLHDTDIPAYQRLYFVNKTGSNVKIKVNDAADYETMASNDVYDSGEAKQETPWQDTITANGTGNLLIFISYWDYV